MKNCRDSWSEVAFCSSILRHYGVQLVLCREDEIPDVPRAFPDVHFDGRAGRLWVAADDMHWLESLWHEVGHCISADRWSRKGRNWVDPYPRYLRRRHRNKWKIDTACEFEACAASMAALEVYGASGPLTEEIMEYVNVDYREPVGSVARWRKKLERVVSERTHSTEEK